jgi:hypothetical protein
MRWHQASFRCSLTKEEQLAAYFECFRFFSLLLAEVHIPQAIAITEPRILFLHGNKINTG